MGALLIISDPGGAFIITSHHFTLQPNVYYSGVASLNLQLIIMAHLNLSGPVFTLLDHPLSIKLSDIHN